MTYLRRVVAIMSKYSVEPVVCQLMLFFSMLCRCCRECALKHTTSCIFGDNPRVPISCPQCSKDDVNLMSGVGIYDEVSFRLRQVQAFMVYVYVVLFCFSRI